MRGPCWPLCPSTVLCLHVCYGLLVPHPFLRLMDVLLWTDYSCLLFASGRRPFFGNCEWCRFLWDVSSPFPGSLPWFPCLLSLLFQCLVPQGFLPWYLCPCVCVILHPVPKGWGQVVNSWVSQHEAMEGPVTGLGSQCSLGLHSNIPMHPSPCATSSA